MKKLTLFLILLILLALPVQGWAGTYGRKCALVIQEGKVPDGEDHAYFPVLLDQTNLPGEMMDTDEYCAGGNVDFGFFSDSSLTNRLDSKKVTCTCNADPASAVVQIRVEVPSVEDTANTTIYVQYINQAYGTTLGDYGDPYDENGSDYNKARYHLGEADAGGGTTYYDATQYSNDGTLTDADDDSTRETGQIGYAIGFNGDADHIIVPAHASLEMGTSDMTISCWVLMAAGYNYFLEKGATAPEAEGYGFFHSNTTFDLVSPISDGTTRLYLDSDNTLALDDSTWRFVAVTHDRSGNATFYSDSGGTFGADGTEAESSFSATDITNSGVDLRIGSGGGGWNHSVTQIDELRIDMTLRSAYWLETVYNNEKSPSTFVVEGTPEDVSSRATVSNIGWWDSETDTCTLDKSITYTGSTDVVPLCVKCSKELSVEIPGTSTGPTIAMATSYPGSGESATYNGYYNDGTNTYLKLNLALAAGWRTTDLSADAVSSLSLGLSSAEDAFSITAADPAVVTCNGHGLSVGQFVYFGAVGETTEILYHIYEITAEDTNTFTLGGLDASGYAAETDDGDEEFQSTNIYVADANGIMLNPDLTAAGIDFSTSAIVLAVPKDANSPWEVKPADGDATTILGLETAVDHLVSGDYVVAQSTAESYTATVAGVTYRILGITNFDCNNLAITVYHKGISGSISNSGSATVAPYNPPAVTVSN